MQFSIIIPTYNRANTIQSAIDSVLSQKYEDFELIIVDDGSTDNTTEIVNSYSDSRILYFKKENEERNIARNYGINKARGKYISFLDSDDKLYTNHLEDAFSLITKNNNPTIIHTNYDIIKENSVSPSIINKRHVKDANRLLINNNFLHCNSIFIYCEVIKSNLFLNSINAVVGEDYFLWLKLAARHKIHLSLQVTNVIIEHEERSLNNIDVDKLKVGITEINKALKDDDVFLNYYGWKAQRYFSYNYIFVALHCAINKRKKECMKYLILALAQFPPALFSKKILAVLKNLMI